MIDYKQILGDGARCVVTTDDFFVDKDGNQFRAVWGLCKIHEGKKVLGFDPKGSASWVMQVGTGEGALFIMGCRIHYLQVCDKQPSKKLSLILMIGN